jgi:hypothetical protein
MPPIAFGPLHHSPVRLPDPMKKQHDSCSAPASLHMHQPADVSAPNYFVPSDRRALTRLCRRERRASPAALRLQLSCLLLALLTLSSSHTRTHASTYRLMHSRAVSKRNGCSHDPTRPQARPSVRLASTCLPRSSPVRAHGPAPARCYNVHSGMDMRATHRAGGGAGDARRRASAS